MERLTLTPSVGVFYSDESYNDYYYGVSGSESRRSGLDQYTAGDSWTPYVGLVAKYQLTQKLYLNASAVYTVLPDDVKNSPMIDRDDSFALMTGLTWRF
jgi:outer membrane protein